ncbi:MAG: hypothetical protein V4479_16015 [Actinomycetota bacterium]
MKINSLRAIGAGILVTVMLAVVAMSGSAQASEQRDVIDPGLDASFFSQKLNSLAAKAVYIQGCTIQTLSCDSSNWRQPEFDAWKSRAESSPVVSQLLTQLSIKIDPSNPVFSISSTDKWSTYSMVEFHVLSSDQLNPALYQPAISAIAVVFTKAALDGTSGWKATSIPIGWLVTFPMYNANPSRAWATVITDGKPGTANEVDTTKDTAKLGWGPALVIIGALEAVKVSTGMAGSAWALQLGINYAKAYKQIVALPKSQATVHQKNAMINLLTATYYSKTLAVSILASVPILLIYSLEVYVGSLA